METGGGDSKELHLRDAQTKTYFTKKCEGGRSGESKNKMPKGTNLIKRHVHGKRAIPILGGKLYTQSMLGTGYSSTLRVV